MKVVQAQMPHSEYSQGRPGVQIGIEKECEQGEETFAKSQLSSIDVGPPDLVSGAALSPQH